MPKDGTRERSEYTEYLHGERWVTLRQARLDLAEARCQLCSSGLQLEVHHRSYERLGKAGEILDLIVLCHERHHGHVVQRISKANPRMGAGQLVYSIEDLRRIARRGNTLTVGGTGRNRVT